MKILQVSSQAGENVCTEKDEYVRYGEDCWFKYYGDDLLPLFNCEKIEEAYQQYLKEQK